MQTVTITKEQARRYLLAHQGLGSEFIFQNKQGVLDFIRHVGCIQYDPINIVGRNAELVLQSRIPEYRPSILQELLYLDRSLLDGWDKVMSIYPTEDWPYFRRYREANLQKFMAKEPIREALLQVREEIRSKGPLASNNLDLDQSIDWAWASTRLARAVLESMWFWGELIVHHKKNTQKVYDYAERHFPDTLLHAPEPNETEEQYWEWRVLRRIGAVGLLWDKSGDVWVGMTDLKSKQRQEIFQKLWQNHKIIQIQIEGIRTPFYANTEHYQQMTVSSYDSLSPRASFIAPLDNLLWDRRMIKELFGFDYTWEVYKPAEKRNYGYYVLPVLYGDTFVARFEPGRDKKSNTFIIKNWWWEPGVVRSSEMMKEIKRTLHTFMDFVGAEHLLIEKGANELKI